MLFLRAWVLIILCPAVVDILSTTVKTFASWLLDMALVNIDMSKISETRPDSLGHSVQLTHVDKFKKFFYKQFFSTTTSNITMGTLMCSEGIASPNSVCDGYWEDSGMYIRGIVEAKSTV